MTLSFGKGFDPRKAAGEEDGGGANCGDARITEGLGLMAEPSGGCLFPHRSSGRTEPVFTSFPKDKGLNGKSAMLKQTVVVNDINEDEDYLLTFSDTKSEIIVPVFAANHETVTGTIDTESEIKNAFNEDDAGFLEECAKSIQSLWNNKE